MQSIQAQAGHVAVAAVEGVAMLTAPQLQQAWLTGCATLFAQLMVGLTIVATASTAITVCKSSGHGHSAYSNMLSQSDLKSSSGINWHRPNQT
jgi:hypothetical protein